MARPWYPKYPDDYARKTAHLSFAEHGAYGLLMDQYYRTAEPLPGDLDALFRITRGKGAAERKALASVVEQFFDARGGRLHLARADEELARARDIHEKRVKGGKCSAHARAHVGTPEPTDGQVRARAIQSQSHTKEASASLGRKNGTRWAESRAVPPEWIADFLTGPHGVGWSTDALRREAVKFENFWTAKTGAAATKLNWKRTFENWCLNAKGQPNGKGQPGAIARIAAKVNAARAEQAGRADIREA